MPPDDTFRSILGEGWVAYRWYRAEEERDGALTEMMGKHAYSRAGDVPSIVCERVARREKNGGRPANQESRGAHDEY